MLFDNCEPAAGCLLVFSKAPDTLVQNHQKSFSLTRSDCSRQAFRAWVNVSMQFGIVYVLVIVIWYWVYPSLLHIIIGYVIISELVARVYVQILFYHSTFLALILLYIGPDH